MARNLCVHYHNREVCTGKKIGKRYYRHSSSIMEVEYNSKR
uniref:Uncharacterized protein n=1 Tax=Arundo donax TaxID=35708 RepID=A0A0A8ZVE4_ARUDO